MKRSVVPTVMISLLAIMIIVSMSAGAEEAPFIPGNYYLISIGTVDADASGLIQTVRDQGFVVIVQTASGISAYRGSEASSEAETDLIAASSLLYVDGNRFLLRVKGDHLDYEVRPSAVGYVIVLVPHENLTAADLVSKVLTPLQQMGIVGEEVDMEYKTFVLDPAKTPAPPSGVAIDSDLYGLAIAPDWFTAASEKGIDRTGLRVEVVAEKVPGGSVPEQFQTYIVSETDALAKLLLPIEDLVSLARAASIGYVRPPYQPQPAVP